MTDSERIERLEHIVRRLAQQVGELRAQVSELRGATAEEAASATDAAQAQAAELAPSAAGAAAPERDAAWRAQLEDAAAWQRAAAARKAADERRQGPSDRREFPWSGAGGVGRSDIEGLVGRYGTVALAALTILVGVGAFLQWAIERITVGPATRVALGLVAAAVVAALGYRLRSRGARQYGNTLIGLALAIVHVDAWGAGPQLHVIPSSVALAIAAVASAVVAVLAWREQEQSLFAVGTGGALLAPFVTSDRSGRIIALLVYGLVVLSIGFYALRGRSWQLARTIMLVGGVVYVFGALFAMPTGAAAMVRTAPAAFALACAWGALTLSGAEHARPLARAYLGALLSALLWDISGYAEGPAERIIPLALVGSVTAYASLRFSGRRPLYGDELTDGVLLPLALLVAALASLADPFTTRGAMLAALWGALALAAWWGLTAERAGDEPEAAAPRHSPVHLMTAGFATALAVLLALQDRAVPCVVALSAHAALFAFIARRLGAVEPALPSAATLVLAAGWAFDLLNDRTPYQYTPFLTAASVAALAASAGWAWWAWELLRGGDGPPRRWPGPGDRVVVTLFGTVPAFVWGREELAHAFSAEASTFLLIFYYAAVGVLAIWVGRRWVAADARKAGLALAVYAALKALAQASELTNIGLRVGSYLLVGGFLLGVAYWYRATNERLTTA